MSATDDRILAPIDEIRAELSATLAAVEAASGFQVCFRVLSARWAGPDGRSICEEPYDVHRSDFCMAWKTRNLPACMRANNHDLFVDCAPGDVRYTGPFLRTCHAGADEVLVPIWGDNLLLAVLFIGQFEPVHAVPRRLPQIAEADREHLLNLARPLGYYLVGVLQRLDELRERPSIGLHATIDGYIREQLAHRPTLAGLSSLLNLSVSRTGHLVRETTGQNFTKLIEQQRIDVSRDLLMHSDATIGAIAKQVGFRDGAYFSRYFKEKTGSTPSQVRARKDRQPVV